MTYQIISSEGGTNTQASVAIDVASLNQFHKEGERMAPVPQKFIMNADETCREVWFEITLKIMGKYFELGKA